MKTTSKRISTDRLTLAGMMTALVIVFQLLATYTAFFGPFSTAIGLIPIAIGSMLCGPAAGAWLGLVFSLVVLSTGGAALFFAFSIAGTIITVIVKGIACGFISGLIYKLMGKKYPTVGAVVSAIACPIVNTGIFLLGSAVFFMPYADAIGELVGAESAGFGVFITIAFVNFLFELGLCTVLSPVIVRILKIRKKTRN